MAFPGMVERLQQEVRTLAPGNMQVLMQDQIGRLCVQILQL